MQAYLTLRYNDFSAELLGNYHEWDGNKHNNQDKAEEIMDQNNNKIGREIGNEIIKENGGNKPNIYSKLCERGANPRQSSNAHHKKQDNFLSCFLL